MTQTHLPLLFELSTHHTLECQTVSKVIHLKNNLVI